MRATTFLALASSVASATPFGHRFRAYNRTSDSCPVVFDGRVPSNASLTDFDTKNGGGWNPFNPDFVKGNDISWSDILLLPKTTTRSRFDAPVHGVPLEVTISDESIFMEQKGFRRAGLQFLKDDNEKSPASEGVKTLHFSIMQDESRPLNLSHEYLNVWHEAGDFSSNQFNFEAGTIIGQDLPKDTWKLLDRNNTQLWSTPMLKNVWQNFAVTLDFEKNTIQAWYSQGCKPLRAATEPISNDNSGRGQYQIGMLKKPTGTDDVANSGFQESGLNEGLIYGGVFIEDSKNGCVSA
ncbi:hypothetical protein FZEAL_548 [Fusarium zealandicum]|uniref:Glycoside hydrolase 131 catalytic N-terminal domain-containing protein n=1 Tax=Fusarium zealandicum TaxID=1053134 RepID=A0A8H4UUG6_9HYPO|nr:hypothetical protein FZEAL_548 [Fusarium zealandicum]